MHAGIGKLSSMKARGEKIAVLTAYDYPTARLLDEGGIDLLLVGDSVGMVVLGYPDTTLVTLDEMVHHTRAVARGAQRSAIMADLPIATYDTPSQAVKSARRLADAGAHAVKLEGGASHVAQIRALVAADIPVMAHIGMQPQRVRIEGGYRMKGKTNEDAERLIEDAVAVQEAGSFGLLLELVHPETSRRITETIRIPTIGIGAGTACDGQVLVTHDLIGLFPWFTPKFVNPAANISQQIREAAAEFIRRTKQPLPAEPA
ncbi:MAG TPA: 3-methyl-2-oxobutanoate hydroxymethyltransferase [Chthoniobacteraceae bacterium]|nr:3-methyl-2-oxobutanoate hydroxymethyltransferase [Chthoniobacteraceae bacterium]